jgi:hypothetical protein
LKKFAFAMNNFRQRAWMEVYIGFNFLGIFVGDRKKKNYKILKNVFSDICSLLLKRFVNYLFDMKIVATPSVFICENSMSIK